MRVPVFPRTLILTAAAASLVAGCGSSEPSRIPADLIVLSGDNQAGSVGTALPLPIVIEVEDREGGPLPGVTVSFAPDGGGSVTPASGRTDSQGRVTVSWTLGTTVTQTQSLTVTADGLSGVSRTVRATASPGVAASGVVVSGGGQTGEVWAELPLPVVFEFHDGFGNPASGEAVTVRIAAGGGTTGSSTGVTDAAGRVSVSWTLGPLVGQGSQQLEVRAGSAAAMASASATLTGGTLAITEGDQQQGAVGQSLATRLAVRVATPSSKPVQGIQVTWQIGTGGGSFDSTSTVSDSTGQAYGYWHLGNTTGAQTVTAGSLDLTPVSVSFTATAVSVPGSTIMGTVRTSDLALLRAGATTPGRVGARVRLPEPTGRLIRSVAGAAAAVPGELLVSYRVGTLGLPALRAMGDPATARDAALTIRARASARLPAGLARVVGVSPVLRTARLRVRDPARLDSVARLLALDPGVLSVQPNLRARPHTVAAQAVTLPNDPYYPNQSWHYAMIGLPRAWSITTGSSSVIVAVLDAGIRFDHPAIGRAGGTYLTGGGNLRTDGYDFVSAGDTIPLCAGGSLDNADDGDGYDPDPTLPDDRPFSGTCLGDHSPAGGHGLHVAGTIGAVGNDGLSVTGVNWQVGIRPVRVIGVESGSYYDIAQGILYAAGLPADDGNGGVLTPPALPARIINMSFGGPCLAGPTPAPGKDFLHDAVLAVTDSLPPAQRVLLVASAGNSASSTAPCPAAYPEVLAVGAVGPSGSRASYSNFGSWVGIAAPGGETNAPDATYWVYSTTCDFTQTPCAPLQSRLVGTSMAAPHVSGVAALLLAQNPALTAAELRARLTTFVTPLDPAEGLGPGIVNAYLALTQGAVPARQLLVTAYDAGSGSPVATVSAPGGSYTISGLPDGTYFVYAGEDEDGDGLIGLPDRRFGAWGGAATPQPVQVSSSAGAFVAFTIGNPTEREPNNAVPPGSRLILGGSIRGSLDAQDPVDLYRMDLPSGTFSFETHGWFGDFCSFALDVNTTLDLLDANQDVLQSSTDLLPQPAGNNYCSRITATVGAGTYYLRVTPGTFFDGSTHSGRYVLWARPGP